jgi:membrane-bound inhibitor of C-type lysozyme
MLSDGRTMILPQTISADGTRYANKDDSVIFWSKGNGLVFTENGKETYTGCIQIAPDSESLPHVYINTTQKFSIRYPLGYSVKDATEDWFGVGFFIATSTTVGTNLSTDTHMSVEEINTKSGSTEECTAGRFLGRELQTISTTTENGVTYSVGTASGAGAGNRYEETIYALIGTNPCFAVRYFIHYSAIENYSEGSVKAFDMQALFTEFDAIRHTLIIGQ